MARSDTTPDLAAQDLELAGAAVAGPPPRQSSARWLRRRLGELSAGISTCALGIAVASTVVVQNVYGQTGGKFQAAPNAPEAGGDASSGFDEVLGVSVNTLFFIAAGVVAVFWFAFGGGRKVKVGRGK